MFAFKRFLTKPVSLCLVLAFISGCSTQPGSLSYNPYKAALSESELYLRGTFNWWGVQESFRFVPDGTDKWSANIYLIGDGVPYDFKIATPNWLPQQNCGSINTKLRVSANTSVKLYCNAQSQNFQFLPNDDGNYTFSITQSDDIYTLRIARVN